MKIRLRQCVACAVAVFLSASPAFAAESAVKAPPREAKPAATAPISQQDKMKLCNAKAKEKETARATSAAPSCRAASRARAEPRQRAREPGSRARASGACDRR